MTVLLENHRLLVTTAPKVACTSIKAALFEVENGFDFRPFHVNGKLRHIHDPAIYPARAFAGLPATTGCLRLTVVGDPLRRFLSAYANRVVHYRELDAQHIGPVAAERDVSAMLNRPDKR